MSVKPTNIPKCHLRQSADSAGNFSRHGKLGEVTENIRTFALPYDAQTYTFKMNFGYDSWNRIMGMTYPDGEVVTYDYNLGGMLYSIEGDKGGQAYMYVKHIAYNQYELKESVLYGNGTLATFEWDHAGNMTMHRLHDECTRRLCWDEENRLQGVADCSYASLYQYDANGERTYKLTGQYSYQNINGHYYPYAVLDNPTLYASLYVVCTPKGYTKHYYAESERVASRIGGGLDSVDMFIRNIEEFIDKPTVEISPLWTDEYHKEPFDEKRDHNLDHLYSAMECTGNVPSVVYECLIILHKYSDFPHHEYEPDCYWYHPDHLGSSSWITFTDGKAVQHLHYLPWGEDFVDQRLTSWSARYAFSAKERDVETGLSYFGARYYSSDLSIWMSVDPMSDKYPSTSPYAYCRNNPVILVDPNGNKDKPYNAKRDKPISIQSGTETFISKTTGFGKVLSYSKKSQQNAYNCHSYAWHNSKGDPTPQKGDIPTAVFSGGLTRWDNSPADDIKEQKAQQLGVDDNNVPGDIVIYYSDANKNNQYDDGEFISHSAVVKTVDEEGNTQTVIGKLGQDGISENHPDAPGYYQEAENPNTGKIEKQSRAYFRISATND